MRDYRNWTFREIAESRDPRPIESKAGDITKVAHTTKPRSSAESFYGHTVAVNCWSNGSAHNGGMSGAAISTGDESFVTSHGSSCIGAATQSRSTVKTSGNHSVSAATEQLSLALAEGFEAVAVATHNGAARAEWYAVALATHHDGLAVTEHHESVAISAGVACGVHGSIIVLYERDENELIGVTSGIVGVDVRFKPGRFYRLRNGDVIDCTEEM